MELTDYLRIVRKNWIAIIVITLLGIGAALTYSLLQTPQYSATTRVFVSTQSGDTGAELAQGNNYTLSRVKTYAQMATSERVLSGVVETLELDVSPFDLAQHVSATTIIETTIIEITALDADPGQSAEIADQAAASLAAAVDEVESVGGQPSPVRLTTIQNARVPETPISPRTTLNIALGAAVGLVIALGLAVLREVLDTRIRSARDLEAATPHPILATIAFDPKAKQRHLVVHTEPTSPRAEAYRTLRTNLQFVQVDDRHRTFVVTSSMPEEGKSTTSANLALALASANQTVLLVDADLRRPRLDEYLGIEGSVGLTDVLIGRARITDTVQQWGRDRLYVLPAGRTPPNPSELLDSKAMTALLEQLRPEFDWVIIDAPPLLPVTDAALLAGRSAGVLLTVAANKTTEHQLKAALEHLNTVDAAIAGIVFTKAPVKGPDAYMYGYEPRTADRPDHTPRSRQRMSHARPRRTRKPATHGLRQATNE
ncbi:polysaccharide biosynthesis tyrosine autokinase [Pseudactinotalea terrae]|uniref:polysaccharide biosynthesis tyrosine autokinase n=1 Tax=Pseudactinotalea terrae TaxID=1743262 RepID=UPI0012E20F15|nr:polysaccharide biosynthesis tyrosine autokinase [Pseudactinotalea terrae]